LFEIESNNSSRTGASRPEKARDIEIQQLYAQ